MKTIIKFLTVILFTVSFSLLAFPASAEEAKPSKEMLEQQSALSAYDDLYQMIMLNGYPYNYSGEYIDGSQLVILISNDDQTPYHSLLKKYNCIQFKKTKRSYKELQVLFDKAISMFTNNEKGSDLCGDASINIINNSVDIEINAIEYIKLSKEERDQFFIDGVNYKFVNSSNILNSLIAEEKNGARGWNVLEGKSYYIKSNGVFATKSCVINGIRYKFSSDGVCQGKYTGWTKSANGRRYFKNGVMLKERWIKTKSGKKYYAGEDGYMRTGWARVDGKTCFFDEKGVWDGKKYYKGYKPVSMKYFLMDFDFSDDIEYEYCINYKKYYDFEGIDVVREILEAEKDKKFIYDNSSDDETELNEGIYHGGKQIIIRCATDTKAADKTPHIIFTKDKDGNSYFYCSQYGFGCKLSDSEAYDKIAELI